MIGAIEFYQLPDQLEAEIGAAQRRVWVIVALLTAATYLLLAGIVGRGSATIRRQQRTLNEQVANLRRQLAEDVGLSERVR